MVRYEYIHFVKQEDKPKTSVWSCRNNNSRDQLGIVKWHSAWRKYCYFSTCRAVYSTGCLSNIIEFVDLKNKEHKEQKNIS